MMTKTFDRISSKISAGSYATKDAAYRAIDIAFESGKITQYQARLLEARVY
jgi:hypothetical protein